MNKERKKELGAYYTPAELCNFLCEWGITKSGDKILEPSFGSGNILQSASDVLSRLGNKHPKRNLYGCDIDGSVCTGVAKKGYYRSHLINKDFLSVSARDFHVEKFDSVIANPPYVSVRGISKHQVTKGKAIAHDWGFNIDGKSSLWAYFIIHAMNFLKEDGRMAWVLPKNYLYSDYAKQLESFICKHFANITVCDIKESFFLDEGTSERVVILLCSGFSKSPNSISCVVTKAFTPTLTEFVNNTWFFDDSQGHQTFDFTSQKHLSVKLGEVADIKIGIVTGASKQVVISGITALENNIDPQYLLPIFAKSSNINSIFITKSHFSSLALTKDRINIIDIKKWNSHNEADYTRFYDSLPSDIRSNTAVNGKKVWYSVANSLLSNERTCDAFLTPMSKKFPRMIINQAKVDCTNSLYRLYIKEGNLFRESSKELTLQLVCLAFYSSFTRLSIEYNARIHGKALKLEPSNYKKIDIFLLNMSSGALEKVLRRVDTMIRNEVPEEKIVSFVDAFYTQHSEGTYQSDIYARFLNQTNRKV